MSVEEIPRSRKYICDGCGKEQLEPDQPHHPLGWVIVTFNEFVGMDHGASLSTKLVTKDMCPSCGPKARNAVNEGSYGLIDGGAERPPGESQCLPQAVGRCE